MTDKQKHATMERTNETCPACGIGRLNFHCGDYGTGVFAPDGYQQTVWEEFFQCNQCQETFDLNDLSVPESKAESNAECDAGYACDDDDTDHATTPHEEVRE